MATAAPASAFIVCAAGVNTFVWDGSANDTPGHVGDNHSWDDAYNWNVDCTPGLATQPKDDNVTIPAGATVTLGQDISADLNSLTNNGTINVTPFGALGTHNTSTSNILNLQGILFGTGRFTITKTLNWTAASTSASTMETRRCGDSPAGVLVVCDTPAPAVGTTVINAGAKLNINGRGVNFLDQRVIENHGTTTISGQGYIAANYGTSFRNVRSPGAVQPRFVFANDGGYYQGFAIAGFGLSTFTNSGLVTKTGGTATGVSVIDAAYSSTDPGSTFTGALQVKIGTLSIFTPSGNIVRTAKVQQGATFANAAADCNANTGLCAPIQPTSDDQQVASVQLTKPGTTSSTVTIQEVSGVPVVPGQRGVPVRIETPNAAADTTAPLRFRILFDASLLLAGETPASFAANAVVARQATTADPYFALPDCDVNGNPSVAAPSCVARTLSINETAALGTGDVVIVISSLLNSRYRVSKVGAA